METWETVNSELTRCTLCGAEFRIGDGESPCACSTPPASVATPRAHTLPSSDGTVTDAAAVARPPRDYGETLYWRAKFREYDGDFAVEREKAADIRDRILDETIDPKVGTAAAGAQRVVVAICDALRKNAWSALQASLPDKHDAEVDDLRGLVERMEAAARRSRAH